jgi:hypothetical protein
MVWVQMYEMNSSNEFGWSERWFEARNRIDKFHTGYYKDRHNLMFEAAIKIV